MTEQTINGIPFPMKELCDFSFLQAYGSVFQVFAQNDSGNISFGVGQGERRFFLKVAGAPTAYSCLSPAQVVENLRTALPLYQRLAHPSLIRLVEHFPQGELYVAVFQWAEGDCLFDHWNFERYAATGELSPGERFRRLPPAEKLAAFREVFAFLRHVEEQGYAPVDFYDGSLLYDFAARRLTICDIDLFRQRPLRNTLGADYPGTKRMKAPEEYQLGADITPATAVFTVGALLSSFFGRASQEELQRAYREERVLPCRRETWQLSQGRYEALCKAMEPNPIRRFPTVGDFWRAWEGEVG